VAYVTTSGPFFDGRADAAVEDACEEAERSIGIIGASMVRTELAGVLRVETPFYRMQVEARPDPPGWRITDQGVIYGHWLEGTGSRNYPRTRFRGYATFRRMTQAIQARAATIGNGVVARYMGQMN
jgi:hypothetical protein